MAHLSSSIVSGEEVDKLSLDSSNESANQFPLLELPPELWVRIVKESVKASTEELRIPDKGDNPKALAAVVQQPAITRTCRAIRRETLRHFYLCNKFVYYDGGTTGEALLWWLWWVQRCEWGPLCQIAMVTRFPNVKTFFHERLERRCLPFRCAFETEYLEEDEDGYVLHQQRYKIELSDDQVITIG